MFSPCEGIPQRQKMCKGCPSRPGRGSVDKNLASNSFAHRCHSTIGSVCAGVLAATPEGLKQLHSQLYEESLTQ